LRTKWPSLAIPLVPRFQLCCSGPGPREQAIRLVLPIWLLVLGRLGHSEPSAGISRTAAAARSATHMHEK
jgi:hypothetical protein